MKRILIIGATSAIASACARRWAQPGTRFYLVARSRDKLATIARDLEIRGASVSQDCLDLDRLDTHRGLLDRCLATLGPPDLTLVAHGTLPQPEESRDQAAVAAACFHTNATSTISLLTEIGGRLAQAGGGRIAVLSSVAGERGRPSNYPYGASKAAVTAFCEGQRAWLFRRGVAILVVKPGFVDTPMTAGMEIPAALSTTPERVAADIDRALGREHDTLYTPWFWSPIMRVIRLLPTFLFKRMDL
ncbi:MAG: SDR family oxidoreductase [Pseudomonadota bacterium]